MRFRFTILVVTIFLLLTNSFSSCKQSDQTEQNQIQKKQHQPLFDSSKTALIRFDQRARYPFDSSHKPATLLNDEFYSIDSLVIKCLTKYNKSVPTTFADFKIDLNLFQYKRQLIVVQNKRGEKEVWLNYFCNDWGSDKWKTEIMDVSDGGKCYFNLKINLTTEQFYDFMVNGYA